MYHSYFPFIFYRNETFKFSHKIKLKERNNRSIVLLSAYSYTRKTHSSKSFTWFLFSFSSYKFVSKAWDRTKAWNIHKIMHLSSFCKKKWWWAKLIKNAIFLTITIMMIIWILYSYEPNYMRKGWNTRDFYQQKCNLNCVWILMSSTLYLNPVLSYSTFKHTHKKTKKNHNNNDKKKLTKQSIFLKFFPHIFTTHSSIIF